MRGQNHKVNESSPTHKNVQLIQCLPALIFVVVGVVIFCYVEKKHDQQIMLSIINLFEATNYLKLNSKLFNVNSFNLSIGCSVFRDENEYEVKSFLSFYLHLNQTFSRTHHNSCDFTLASERTTRTNQGLGLGT